jgi:hypothetical protein
MLLLRFRFNLGEQLVQLVNAGSEAWNIFVGLGS